MEASGDLIVIRMRLSGGREVAAEARLASGAIKEVGASAAATNATTARATGGIRQSMMRTLASAAKMRAIGRTLTTYVSIPLIAMGGLAVKSSLDFSSAMSQIHTQAGATAGEVDYLRGRVLDFAASGASTHGPQQLADSLFHIESAGYRSARAMDVLRTAEALATTGHADMESTTNALVGALRSGIKGTKDLGQTAGTMNAIIGAGNMRMDDLAGAMGTGILPRAKTLGISLKQVGAAIATMTRQGQPARISATRFAMAMNMMMAPTDKAKEALAGVGIQAEELGTMMQKGDLPGALELLRSHLDGLGGTAAGRQKQAAAISAIFGGGRTAGGIQTILTGLDQYQSTLKQIDEQGTPKTFEELHKAAQEDPAARLAAAWAQLQAAFVRLGDVLIPVVIPAMVALAAVITTLADGFAAAPGPVQVVIVTLAVLAAIAGPAIFALGALAGAVKNLIAAYGWFSKTRAGAIAADWIGGFTGRMRSGGGKIRTALRAAIALPRQLVQRIATTAVGEFIGSYIGGIRAKGGRFRGAGAFAGRAFALGFLLAMPFLVKRIGDKLADAFGNPDVKAHPTSGALLPGSPLSLDLSGVPGAGTADKVLGFFGGNAAGTAYWRGGPTWVGEQGPEIADLPRGTRIFSAPESQRMMRRSQQQVRGSKRLAGMQARRGGGADRQPIVLQVDGRVLAETTVTLQDDEEARR